RAGGARACGDPDRRGRGARRARPVAVDPIEQMSAQRIAAITLDERTVGRRSPEIENERAAAIGDLLQENSFAPVSGQAGPFALHLAVEENRLLIDINGADQSSETVQIGLGPFR